MATKQGLKRKAHFLGTKIKSLRKRNRLTLEDLSVRCIQIDAEAGPSVSYLSMIENGKRVPSERLLQIIAEIFQKEPNWFFDESLDVEAIDTAPNAAVQWYAAGARVSFFREFVATRHTRIARTNRYDRQAVRASAHPCPSRRHATTGFLTSNGPRRALGTSNSLYRVEDVFLDRRMISDWKSIGSTRVRFEDAKEIPTSPLNMLVRSFYDAPNKVYLNRSLEKKPARLKYDLANHIAHKVLHDGDGARAPQISGRTRQRSPARYAESPNIDAKDVLFAWRDFECSYFAAALLGSQDAVSTISCQTFLCDRLGR